MTKHAIREYYADGLEGGVAEYKCDHCGEWFTELELSQKQLRDKPCSNCGNDNYTFHPIEWASR